MDRLRAISLTSRTLAYLIVAGLILVAIFAFFTSRIGQQALLICCGGLILLGVIGWLSERGMRRPR